MSETGDPFHLHPAFRWTVVHVGLERQPVIVIDDFLQETNQLIDYAATQAKFLMRRDVAYPGFRAAAPPEYSIAVKVYLRDLLRDTFGLGPADIAADNCEFAIVTTPPEMLQLRQRIPHIDAPDSCYIAGLHYLCGPELGGTSFYRHRRTGFESVDLDRRDLLQRALQGEIAASGAPPVAYIDGDTDLFVRTASFDAAFNRLLFYRGVTLHSGNISRDFGFDANPRTGRLTISSFFLFQ
jgi:hypothetical protein